jgi:hypothetical protein
MQLTQEQLDQYTQQGYLLLPEGLEEGAVEAMRQELPDLFHRDAPDVIKEKDQDTVRSIHGTHNHNEVFQRLVRHPALLEPARQVLGTDVYVYQFKINAKKAFKGDVWEWHQDYIFWLKEDGLPRPDLVNIGVFLDEVTEFNGPLLFIPGSHQHGVFDIPAEEGSREGYEENDWIADFTADLKYSIDQKTLQNLVQAGGGIQAPKGPSGSLLLFHPNTVHGSVPNISPYDRTLVLVTYCSVDNVPTGAEYARPEFLVSRDHTAVSPLPSGMSLAG